MDAKKIGSLAIWLGIPIIMILCPPPEGLSSQAWILSAFYICAILGLVTRPLPDAAVLFVVMGAYSLLYRGEGISVSGFSSTSCWLVFSAFLVGRAFIDTGFGARVAYILIDKFGHTTLGLGYVAAMTDGILSPAIPSTTARTGGIVLPIFRSLAVTLGSEPGPTARKVGGYMTLLLHWISMATGTMFLTANAINLMVIEVGKNISPELSNVTWGAYALALAPLGGICLFVAPWLVYKLYKPELEVLDNKKIAAEGLQKLGPMGYKEKVLLVLFVTALLLWATGGMTKIGGTAVAIGFVGALLFFNVVTWEQLVSEKAAWTTLVWYGAIIGFASGLAKFGYFKWMAAQMAQRISFEGMGPVTVILIIVAVTLPLRYLFASLAAYVATMVPVMFTLAKIGGVPPQLACYALIASLCTPCLLTHFGNAVSPVLFGAGYVDQKTWWTRGFIMTMVGLCIIYGLGIPWWKIIGLY